MPFLLPLLLAATRTDLGGWKWTSLPAGWVITLAAIVIFLFLRALYRFERGRAGAWTRLLLAGLRTAVLLLLLLVLAGPYREEVRTAEERSHLVLLVDASGSMGTSDRYPGSEVALLRDAAWGVGAVVSDEDVLGASRLDLLKRVLAPEGEALLRELDERFVLHVFAFDVNWRGIGSTREEAGGGEDSGASVDAVARIADGIRGLQATGGGTDLGTVLQSVSAEFLGREDRRLAGVLLITDGRDTSAGATPLEALAGLGVGRTDLHVTPIALGNSSSGRNVRMERIRAMDWVLVEDDVVFETAIRHVGFTGLDGVRAEATIVQIADAEGNELDPPRPYEAPEGAVLEAGPLRLGLEDEPAPVRLQARMREPGTFRVRVRAVLPPEDAELDAVREDDETEHVIRVVDQRIKILYVDAYPRYELRFLRNWLVREPTPDPSRPEHRRRYEAHTLLQGADPTVEQESSPGLTSIRSFPRTRRELFAYDVLILGDVDWLRLGDSAQTTHDILALIRDFVDEGGGLVLQAGEDYNNPLDLIGTPLADLLPVSISDKDRNPSDHKESAFRLQLTDVGRRHPIFGIVPGRDGGIASPDELAAVWSGEAPWARFARNWLWWWAYRPKGGLRPGAVALARAWPVAESGPGRLADPAFRDDSGRPVVLLATLEFGRGRVFWTGLDSLWRLRHGQGDRFYGPFWDQIIRYLATYRQLGGNRRFKISTDKELYFAGETATVTITALDRDFEPLASPFLDDVHVESPDGEDLLLAGDQRPANASPEGAAPGTYQFYLPLRTPGSWRLWMEEAERERTAGGRAEKRIDVVFRAPELRQTVPDHEVLTQIRAETDGLDVEGRLARLYDLPTVAKELPARTALRVLDRRERTQWDRPWVLLLLVGLLGLEWAIRKRWQMI